MDHRARQHAATIEDLQRGLADVAVDALIESDPTVEARYGDIARRTWRTESESRLAHLAQSVACGRPGLYAGHVAWAMAALRARQVPEHDIRAHLGSIERALDAELPEDARGATRPHLDAARATADAHAGHAGHGDGLLADTSRDATLARLYLLHLLQRDTAEALALVQDALRGGMPLGDLYERVVAPALGEIGRMWSLQEASIADEHFCTAATRTIVAQLRASAAGKSPDGRRALCMAVGGDMHDVGVRMAADLLELDGWTVEFLGANVPEAEAVISVEEAEAEPGRAFDLVVASAATVLSLRALLDLLDALRASPVGKALPVLVGGAPFAADPGLAAAIGASAGATTLTGAVREAARLVPPRAVRRPR
jgi:methanogenic corrinoid protein MtbC1